MSSSHTCYTVVDCGQPPAPDNGAISVTQTVFNSTALYICNNGYLLNGPIMRVCQDNGTWSGVNPTCERMLSKKYVCESVFPVYSSLIYPSIHTVQ